VIPTTGGRIRCNTLGVDLFLTDLDLLIVDSETGIEQLKKADFGELAREREQVVRIASENRVRELEEELRRRMGREV
jgi:hypothetical protein